jgi:transcriptional regulator CtsR
MGWDSKTSTADDPKYNRVVEILEKSEKKARPRKLKTLSQAISSMFQKNISQENIDRIIRMLFANKMISENNNSITYQF